jgi:hypothetical protein
MNQMARFLSLAAVLAAGAVAAAPVAMVTDLQGKVLPEAAGAEAPAILASLDAGSVLQVADGASLVVVYFESGKEYSFKGPSTVRFVAGQPQVVLGNQPASRDPLMGKVAGAGKIKPVGKIQAAVVMRGANQAARLKLENLAGTRVLETRPEFRWQAPEEGASYSFELTDADGQVLLETAVQGTSFMLPDSIALREDVNYTWLVSAKLPDGRKYSNAGDFTIAPAKLRAEVEAVRPGANARTSERVTYAAWLDQLQFHDEARKYWKELSAARSGDANLNKLAGQ